jgi:7-cyano-7-deazaguanine synthase
MPDRERADMTGEAGKERERAVVLLSGGIDSSTVLALAQRQKYEAFALTVDYGQRHRYELAAAKRIAHSLGAAGHLTVTVDLRAFGGSALTADLAVPKGRDAKRMCSEIPATYVPARNTVLLSLALAWTEVLDAGDIFIGANAVDYSGYPDCRPEYLEYFEGLANLATKAGVEGRVRYRIHAPLLHLTKAEIIRTGVDAGVDFSLTHSCYDPAAGGLACGTCDSCILRRRGFQEAGIPDPTRYA